MGMLTVLLVIDQTGLMGRLLGAMAIHEAGHLTMMVLVGCSPKEIRFLPFEALPGPFVCFSTTKC